MWALAGERTPPIRLTVAVVPAVAVTGGTIAAVNAPEPVIKYRQSPMKSAGTHLATVVLPAQGRVDFADGQATASRAIVDLFEDSGVTFPEGTAEGDTRTRAKIREGRAPLAQPFEQLPSDRLVVGVGREHQRPGSREARRARPGQRCAVRDA